MIEILVVIAIIAILIAIAFTGGSAVINSGKTRDTQALFATLDQALLAYHDEVKQSRMEHVEDIFNGYPPDDIDVFYYSVNGTPVAGCDLHMVRSGQVLRGTTTVPMGLLDDQRGSDGMLSTPRVDSVHHGDIRAMVLAMRVWSSQASAILDRIDPRLRVSAREEAEKTGTSILVWDRGDGTPPIPLDYYVDAWGTPLEYYATRIGPCKDPSKTTVRQIASSAFMKANNGKALLASYGPNGPDQLSADFLSTGDSTLVGDWWDNTAGTGAPDHLINNPLNDDNVYSSDVFQNRMRQAAP
jgi:type II secretory pathway pseudopilin PulG